MMKYLVSVLILAAILVSPMATARAQGPDDLRALLEKALEEGWTIEAGSDSTFTVTNGDGITLVISVVTDEEEADTAESATLENTYNVIPTGTVNVRACPSTTCDLVGSVSPDDVLEVLEEAADEQGQGDWLRFELNGEEAWVAGWLTQPGPDVYLTQAEFEDGYSDEATECFIVLDVARGSSDMAFVLAGDARSDIYVDIFRPNESYPLQVSDSFHKTFIDTGDPYIHQVYSWNVGFPTGDYTIDLVGPNGARSIIEFEYSNVGKSTIYVMCD